jgi:hypothetical protein
MLMPRRQVTRTAAVSQPSNPIHEIWIFWKGGAAAAAAGGTARSDAHANPHPKAEAAEAAAVVVTLCAAGPQLVALLWWRRSADGGRQAPASDPGWLERALLNTLLGFKALFKSLLNVKERFEAPLEFQGPELKPPF